LNEADAIFRLIPDVKYYGPDLKNAIWFGSCRGDPAWHTYLFIILVGSRQYGLSNPRLKPGAIDIESLRDQRLPVGGLKAGEEREDTIGLWRAKRFRHFSTLRPCDPSTFFLNI
jgi:hypothetical protein